MKDEEVQKPEDSSDEKDDSQVHRLDRIYYVVKESADPDDLILSMTVMENPPRGN